MTILVSISINFIILSMDIFIGFIIMIMILMIFQSRMYLFQIPFLCNVEQESWFTILTFCPGGSACSACLVSGSLCCSRCQWTWRCRGCPWGCWSPSAARTTPPQPRSWTWAAVSSGYCAYTRHVGDVWQSLSHLGGLAGRWWRLDIRASIDFPDLLFWWENERDIRDMFGSVFLSLDPAPKSS